MNWLLAAGAVAVGFFFLKREEDPRKLVWRKDVARVKVEDREMVLDVVQTAKGWLLRLKKLSGRKTWAEGVEVFPTKKGAKEAAQKMIDGVPPSMPVEML